MTRFMALVLGAVLLAGCTGPTYTYSKPDGSPMGFKQDSYACVQDASIDAKPQAYRLYKMCMEARGWTAEGEPRHEEVPVGSTSLGVAGSRSAPLMRLPDSIDPRGGPKAKGQP